MPPARLGEMRDCSRPLQARARVRPIDAFPVLIFAARDEDGEPLILPPGVGLGREPQWRAIAMAFTSGDLIDLAERMRNSPYGDDYLSLFAGGLGEAEKFDVAAKVFSQITSPQGRLQFCAFFLGGLAQRANSLRKEETEWTPTEQDAASLTILDQILEGNPQPEFDFREDEKN